MTGDNCKVITSWVGGRGQGGQVPDSHVLQLATGPPLPAPHAGHNNNNNSYIALYPVKIYKLAALVMLGFYYAGKKEEKVL